MTQELKGEIALVTGASRGIGAAIADELAARGATVVGTATSEGGANAIGERLAASAQTEVELVDTVKQFHGALGEMTESSSRVGETLENMHRSAETREQELIDLLMASRRSSMLAIVFCGLGAAVAIVIAVVAMVG